jgi:hypothetical protein
MHASGVIGRILAGAGCLALVLGLLAEGCSSYKADDAQSLLNRIAHGSELEVSHAIYGFGQASPAARKALIGMLKPLRAPAGRAGNPSIEASRTEGDFTMLIVRLPWPVPISPSGRQPVIICHREGAPRVVGYVMPFNDIIERFNGSDRSSMLLLSRWWMETSAARPG